MALKKGDTRLFSVLAVWGLCGLWTRLFFKLRKRKYMLR